MARGNEVGRYVLPIMPSIEGIGPEIDRKLGRAFTGISKSASKALADGAKQGVAEAERAVKASSQKIAALRDKEADAAGRVRVAEERLKEVREKGSGGAALARAEEAREKALRGQAAVLRTVKSETSALEGAQRRLAAAQRDLSNSAGAGMAAGVNKFAAGIGSELNGLTGRFGSIGRGAGAAFAIGAGAAIVAGGLFAAGEKAAGLVIDGFKSIIDTGLDFSKTLNNFQGVTRASAAEMQQMQQAARALGSDTHLAGASASDAALAMTELAKAGFSVDEAMAAARGTLELATAGQIDAAKAAEIQSNAMNAFSLKPTEAAHVADLLANAAIASSADITDLGQALQQVGGIANGFGENLDDTIAALAIFANAGVKGSDAGTLLKTTMQSITDQGNPAQGAIKELGLELYKLNNQGQNQFVGFRELFRQLDEAKKRLNDPEIFQAQTNILFGSDAMRSAMLGNAEAFDDMYTKLERVGAAGEMANAQMQGLPGAVEAFKNTTESIKLEAFDALGPALTEALGQFVDYLSTHHSDIASFFKTIGDAAFTMGKVVLSSFGWMARGAANIADAFGADGVAKDLRFAADAAQEAFGALDDGQQKLRLYADRAAAAGKLTDALGDSVSTLKTVGDDVTIDVKENTPAVRDKLAGLQAHLEEIANDPTHLKIVPDTPEADKAINAFRQQQQGVPLQIPLGVHFDPGKSFLPEWMKYIGGQAGPAPLPVSFIPAGPAAPAPSNSGPLPGVSGSPSTSSAPIIPMPRFTQPRAAGGLFGAMPSSAVIQPATPGLVQWAEPSTGGEAFIPLRGGQRSVDIWLQTGRLLGIGMQRFDMGGFSPDVLAAEQLAGTGYSQGGRTDCSGMPARVINRTLGWPDTGLMSTKNAAQWLAERGFRPGIGGPGSITVGWYDHGPNPNDGHMAMTLSNGMNAEAGGKNGVFTVGSGAAGASDPMFDQHMYLPIQSMYGEGAGSDGGFGGFGGSYSGGGAIPAGATAGVNPQTGEQGYYLPDAKKVRDANQRVDDAEARVRRAEQRVSELKADAKESTKQAAQDELAKAKREAADARADAEDAKKGKFHANRGGSRSGQNGDFGLGGIGSIFGSFLKETFGLDGSLFPDISSLMPVQMLGAALGAFKGPLQGLIDGQLGIQQPGWTPGMPVPGAAGEGQSGGLPFGMIPNAVNTAGYAGPGMALPATPAGEHTGSGAAPGPVDMSRNVSIQVDSGPTSSEIGNVVRREVANVDRLHTYVPRGA